MPVNKKIRVRIRYKGLHGRVLTAASPTRDLFYDRKIDSDEVDVFADMTIQEINDDMAASVKRFTDPFFELFEFFELSDEVLSQIVMNFQDGKIS